MKNLIIIFVSFLFIQCTNAQYFKETIKGNGNVTQQNIKIKEFEEIKIAGDFYVELYNGKEDHIDISIEDNLMEYLEVKNENNSLSIGWEENYQVKNSKKVVIRIPVQDLNKIVLAGSTDLNSKENFKFVKFELNSAGSSNISLNIATDDLSVSLAGSTQAILAGNAQNAKISLAGSGEFNGYDLVIKEAKVSVAGSGKMKINVEENLKASVAGSGSIIYKGNPKNDNLDVAGSGTIKMWEE